MRLFLWLLDVLLLRLLLLHVHLLLVLHRLVQHVLWWQRLLVVVLRRQLLLRCVLLLHLLRRERLLDVILRLRGLWRWWHLPLLLLLLVVVYCRHHARSTNGGHRQGTDSSKVQRGTHHRTKSCCGTYHHLVAHSVDGVDCCYGRRKPVNPGRQHRGRRADANQSCRTRTAVLKLLHCRLLGQTQGMVWRSQSQRRHRRSNGRF